MASCGLDFGTSHSTISVNKSGGRSPSLVEIDGEKVIRSALFFDNEQLSVIYGQKAIDSYLSGIPGRLMVGLKSILGSALMGEKTAVLGKMVDYQEILSTYVSYLKDGAERSLGTQLTKVVAGRPVKFHNDDPKKDANAEEVLQQVLHSVGFKEVTFLYEPVAAAYDYWQSVTKETLVVIADLGGGTCDFTTMVLPKYGQGKPKILATTGIRLGGTDLDTLLSLKSVMPKLGYGTNMKGASCDLEVPRAIYQDLSTWWRINFLYQNNILGQIKTWYPVAYEQDKIDVLKFVLSERLGHSLLNCTEFAKRGLSDSDTVEYNQSNVDSTLRFDINKSEFEEVIADSQQKLVEVVQQLITDSGIHPNDVDLLYFTGGTSKVPAIQANLAKMFPNAQSSVQDVFGSVGKGLAEYAKAVF